MHTPPLHILGIAGSLRAGSYNQALLRAAQSMVPPDMVLRVFEGIASLPPYNQDVEDQGFPKEVQDFHQAIQQADALLIATPEYNYGVPGILKNAIDWASRPPSHTPLIGKPVALMGASISHLGTVRSQRELRQHLSALPAYVMLKPEVLVANAHQKFTSDGYFKDEAGRKLIKKLLDALPAWIERFRS